MIEQEDGTYKEDTSNTWPTSGYQYNADMSGCIDLNGNKLDGVLSYDSTTNIATVDTGNTSYCYLYFSIPKWCNEGETASECLLRNPSAGLDVSTTYSDLYRYFGEDIVNNYVCFGTDDKTKCSQFVYSYRIIGINENGELKIMSSEPWVLGSWSDDPTVEWPDSYIFKMLNENEMGYSEKWFDKIQESEWKYGSISGYEYDSIWSDDFEKLLSLENKSINAKYGLLSFNDIFLSMEYLMDLDWIYEIALEDLVTSAVIVPDEYLVVEYNLGNNVYYESYYAQYIPSIYLKSSIKIINGTGTIDDPFIME